MRLFTTLVLLLGICSTSHARFPLQHERIAFEENNILLISYRPKWGEKSKGILVTEDDNERFHFYICNDQWERPPELSCKPIQFNRTDRAFLHSSVSFDEIIEDLSHLKPKYFQKIQRMSLSQRALLGLTVILAPGGLALGAGLVLKPLTMMCYDALDDGRLFRTKIARLSEGLESIRDVYFHELDSYVDYLRTEVALKEFLATR